MANELQTKLDEILLDKNTNLLPEHLKAGVTCLGVEGIYSAESKIKQFNSVDEMNASQDNNDGDLALVINLEYITPTDVKK